MKVIAMNDFDQSQDLDSSDSDMSDNDSSQAPLGISDDHLEDEELPLEMEFNPK